MTGAEIYLRAHSDKPPSRAEMLTWLRRSAPSGGEGSCLLTALGLTRGEMVRARDTAMLEAAQSLGADDCDAWALAGRLEAAVARFRSLYWPRLKAGGQVAGLGPADLALCRVFRADVRVISSQRKLYEFLNLHGIY